jgi:serine/threonine protein kinase/tetratricopeptide (TPR) repeat protein
VGDPSDDSSSGGGDDVGFADTVTPVISPPIAATPPRGTETAPSTSVMGGRPESDKLVRAVSRAKIASKLFAKTEQVKLGRYHLLEMVGSGGMGVVWGAWDPELDRRVAIKLVKAEMQAARDRILLEGQALAKLSHPNVVPVYDVGVVDEQVYLVMEWVRGKNLRAYCKEPHTVREILAIYRAAGEGLSAAHRAGLIHRDFKPDNAILGDDGRVRVLDFGLARGEVKAASYTSDSGDQVTTPSSDLTRGAGTPRYMPPEQAEGKELSPSVDQYAFCVSLREALSSRVGGSKSRQGEAKTARPEDREPAKKSEPKKAVIPAWIDTILDRGTSQEAVKRFPSMDDLLRALARDPATIWRRRLVVVGAMGVAGAAFAIGTFRAGGTPAALETCGSKEQIASSWNDDLRTKLSTHLATLGPYGAAEAGRLGTELDGYAERWSTAHRGACLAKERKELTETIYTQNLVCLARTRTALETMVGVLSKVDQQRLPNAVAAVGGLPNPARCLIETQSSTLDPPPPEVASLVTEVLKQVERARVLALSSADGAIEVASNAVKRAEELKYLPLIARANLEHGVALVNNLAKSKEAVVALQRAIASALEANDNAVAVEAYARQIPRLAKTSAKELPPNARDLLGAIPVFESLARGLGPTATFARALLYNNIGLVRLNAGERDVARGWFERARAERELGADDTNPELNIIWENLGLVAQSAAERDRLLGIANSEFERRFGRDHPNALNARVNAAMLVANPQRSLAMLREPCRQYLALHRHLEERVVICAFEAGWIADDLEQSSESRSFMASIRMKDPQALEQVIAGSYLSVFDRKLDDAIVSLVPFVATHSVDDEPWVRFRSVDASLVLAAAQSQQGRARAAADTLDRALKTLTSVAPQFGALVLYQRRLARVRAELAVLLRESQPRLAEEHARQALAWYRDAGGYEARIAKLAP